MAVKFANNVSTSLSAAIDATQTTISVADASGLPTLSSGDYVYLTIDTDTNSPTIEVVKVTAISSNSLTVVRGQDGTTASSFSSGTKVELRVTAAALDDIASAADTESVSIDGDTMTGGLTLESTLLSKGHSSGDNWMPYTDGNFYIRAPLTIFDNNVRFADGSGILEISGDNSSNHYLEGDGQIRIRPNGTTINKIVLDSAYINAPAYQVAGTSVLTSGRALQNITSISSGAIASTGTISTTGQVEAGTNIQLGGGYNLSWGGAYSSGKPTIAANSNTIYFYPTGNVSGQRLYLNATGLYNSGTFSSGAITSSGAVSAGSHVSATTDLISNQDIQMNRSGTTPAITVYHHQAFRLVTGIGSGTSRTSTVGVNTSGIFYTNTGFAVNNTTVIDSSRNLTNIGKITATGNGVASSPVISITSSNSASFIHASNAFAANMTAGQFHGHFVGKAGSTKNAGGLGYYWAASGSDSNFVSFGHWGADHLLRLYGNGNLNIHSGGLQMGGTAVISSTRRLTPAGIQMSTDTGLYATDATLSYYSSSNAVYLNGAGANGWLRLNASGASNDRTAINLFGQNTGDNITFKTAGTQRMNIDSSGVLRWGSGNTAILDASFNVSNIGTISSGAITSSGDIVTTDSSGTNKVTLSRYTGVTFRGNGTSSRSLGTTSNDALNLIQNNQTRVIIDTTGNVVFNRAGNTNRGNIAIGPQTSNAPKWSSISGAHYNQTTGSGNGSGAAGIFLIGSHAASGYNDVYIGGGPYEMNPATNIRFHTHTATTHSTGGSLRMLINPNGQVGVNTTNFATTGAKLQVKGTSSAGGVSGSNFAGSIFSVEGSSTVYISMGTTGASSYYGWIEAHDAGTGTNYDLNLNQYGGDVGIGMSGSNPQARLHVMKVGTEQSRFAYDVNNYTAVNYNGFNTVGGSMLFKVSGADKAKIDSSGHFYLQTGDYKIGSTTVIDSSRNLTNIGKLNTQDIGTDGTGFTGMGFGYSSNTLTRAVGSGVQWYKVAAFVGGVKAITMRVSAGGDNTNATDTFFISCSSYGMKANIMKFPSTRYNGSKLMEVRTKFVSGANYEIWVKLNSITTSAGSLHVSMNDSGCVSSLTAGTEPTYNSSYDATLVVTVADRSDYAIQTTGKIETNEGYAVNDQVFIDSNRNISNVGNITSSGQLRLNDGADIAWAGGYGANKPLIAANGNLLRFYTNGASGGVELELSSSSANFQNNSITTTGNIARTGTEGREIQTYMASSYTTGDLVAGHEYGWYNDHWRLGMTRSGDANGDDFVIQFNGSRQWDVSTTGNVQMYGRLHMETIHDKKKIGMYGPDGTGAEWIGTSTSTLELSGGSINLNGANGTGTPNFKMGGTTVIDSSRNLTNIGTISTTGNIDAGGRVKVTNWLELESAGAANTSEEAGIRFDYNDSPLWYVYKDNSNDAALHIQSAAASGESDGAPRVRFARTSRETYFGGSVGINRYNINSGYALDVNGSIRTDGLTSDGQISLSGNNLAVFGPNTGWSASLAIGGNANNSTSTRASIGATNGNLHIDAAAGSFATYLNFYDGTGGVYFGGGASAQVAHVNSSGHLNLAGLGTSQSGYALSINGTGVLDTSRNLANINNYSGTGGMTLTSTANNHLVLAYNSTYYWSIYRENTTGDLVFDTTNTSGESLRFNAANKRVTVQGSSDRPITIGVDGSIETKGNTGGWAMGLNFLGSSNTNHGGFGALGGGDGFSYYYIGAAYNNASNFRFYKDGGLQVGATTILTNTKVLQNVTANASIINSGSFALARMPANLASMASTSADSGLYFRAATEKISGETYATAFYAYNANDGFLFLNRDGSNNAKAVFHIGGYNNAVSAGYSSEDTVITISRNNGAKANNLATGLSASGYRSRIVKTTTETIFADTQGKHRFEGISVARRNSSNFIAETSSNPGGYYAIFEANYDYANAFRIRAKGAGSEYAIMKWADAAGLEFNGGANSIIKFSGDNLSSIGNVSMDGNLTFGNNTTDGRYDIVVGSQTTSRGMLLAPYVTFGTRYSGWDAWIGSNTRTAVGTTDSGIELATSYTASGAAALNLGFQDLHYYTWTASQLSGLSSGSSLSLGTAKFSITGAGHLQIGQVTVIDNARNVRANEVWGTANATIPHRLIKSSSGVSGATLLVESTYGNHSWGITGEFRIAATASGHDTPSILFSNARDNNTFSVGYGYNDTGTFRIKRDHGHRNSGWGTALMSMDRSGNVTFAGNVTAYSDERLKTNIKTISNAVETVNKIRGVTFDWKETGEESMGVVAQEIEAVPELRRLVSETPEDGTSEFRQKNVAYGNMVGLLIEAIKEQSAQIESLNKRIEELENGNH